MNRNKRACTFLVLALLWMFLSCISCIDENRDDCGEVVIRFDYSYNILSANAFEKQVNKVTLYVFDKKSKILVLKEIAQDNLLKNELGFKTNRLEAGEYIFAAWAQGAQQNPVSSDYGIPVLKVGISTVDDLTYYIERVGNSTNRQLSNLLIGVSEAKINDIIDMQYVNLNLKKVNRTVRVILLPYTASAGLDVNDYEFSIEDKIGNGHINYDYNILEDASLTYFPYYKANLLPAPSELLDPDEINKAAVAEISLSRILVSNNPKLIIKSNTHKSTLFSVSLPWLLSLTSSENHTEWDLQEYLDRQDEFAITLFIDNDSWIKNTIIVNGWVINNIPIEM